MNPTFDFSGQVALVPGARAETGIGYVTAQAVAPSGATVVLCDIGAGGVHGAAERLTAEGHHVLGVSCDVADESAASFGHNLRGVWTCMKHELRHMRAQGRGTVVNCSSLGGVVGQTGRATYHASKHGVIGLTKSAAMDYAPLGVRINAVCPGMIATPMADDLIHHQPEAMDSAMRDQPMGRPGRPEEVAAALWLCSPPASLMLGVALPVGGGSTAH